MFFVFFRRRNDVPITGRLPVYAVCLPGLFLSVPAMDKNKISGSEILTSRCCKRSRRVICAEELDIRDIEIKKRKRKLRCFFPKLFESP